MKQKRMSGTFLNGTEFALSFSYDSPGTVRKTIANIEIVCTNKLIENTLIGQTTCNPSDQFNKETGRKLALARALKNISFKEDRKTVWDAYFNRIPKP